VAFGLTADLVENSTISDNHARFSGGGIFHDGGPLTISNVTISYNNVGHPIGQGGGLFTLGGGGGAVDTLKNVILADNTVLDPAHGPDCFGPVASATNTLIQTYDPVQGPVQCAITTSTANQLNQPAALGPLQNNGGGTPTRVPGIGSAAIENGTNTGCPTIDQRGRPRPSGTNCDIGAIEVRGPLFADVPASDPFSIWVEDLATAGVTSGCSATNYCPNDPVTREQMAVFLVKSIEGSSFTPPPCTTAPFPDVPCSSIVAR
jgi:hypothetical protein